MSVMLSQLLGQALMLEARLNADYNEADASALNDLLARVSQVICNDQHPDFYYQCEYDLRRRNASVREALFPLTSALIEAESDAPQFWFFLRIKVLSTSEPNRPLLHVFYDPLQRNFVMASDELLSPRLRLVSAKSEERLLQLLEVLIADVPVTVSPDR